MKNIVSIVVGIAILGGCGHETANVSRDTNDVPIEEQRMMPVEPGGGIGDGAVPLEGLSDLDMLFANAPGVDLVDVTGGNASGQAKTVIAEGITTHRMTAIDLPALTNGDFYEGWIVSTPGTPDGVLSTGVLLQQEDGTWFLQYSIDQELPDHKTVVLTLEPDDDDPAPAKHILEDKKQSKSMR